MNAPTVGARYVVIDAGEKLLDLDAGTLVTIERVDTTHDGCVFATLHVPSLDMMMTGVGWLYAALGLRLDTADADVERARLVNERIERELKVYDLLADRGVHGAMALATRIVAALFPAGPSGAADAGEGQS